MFDGKTLKHLKSDEVEDYRAAIDRGRQLKQIDRQIKKLQQQLEQLIPTTDSSGSFSTPQETPLQNPILSTESLQRSLEEQPETTVRLTDLAEQERLVKQVLAQSQKLRDSLRQSGVVSQKLRTRYLNLRNGHPRLQ
jgi:hypothetical protein